MCILSLFILPMTQAKFLFYDSFENGLDNWELKYSPPKISDLKVHSGNHSYTHDGDHTTIELDFGNALSKVFSVWVYDDPEYYSTVHFSARNDYMDLNCWIGTEYYDDFQKNRYTYCDGNKRTGTIRRSTGWHQYTFDATKGTEIDIYVDDNLVYTDKRFGSISRIGLRFNAYPNTPLYKIFFDDVLIVDSLAELKKVDVSVDKKTIKADGKDSVTVTVTWEGALGQNKYVKIEELDFSTTRSQRFNVEDGKATFNISSTKVGSAALKVLVSDDNVNWIEMKSISPVTINFSN